MDESHPGFAMSSAEGVPEANRIAVGQWVVLCTEKQVKCIKIDKGGWVFPHPTHSFGSLHHVLVGAAAGSWPAKWKPISPVEGVASVLG